MSTGRAPFILFHRKRHPNDMGEREISQFLTDLAVEKNVSASTQNQHVKGSPTCQGQH